jgi:hypothetical protein
MLAMMRLIALTIEPGIGATGLYVLVSVDMLPSLS